MSAQLLAQPCGDSAQTQKGFVDILRLSCTLIQVNKIAASMGSNLHTSLVNEWHMSSREAAGIAMENV